jgi:DNA polymerase-3 subunit alpha
VVISPKPLTEYLPLQRGSEEGDVITQYEMHAVEDLGLLKMDFLGLANLSIIGDTLAMVKNNHGTVIDIESIPLEDPKAFRVLQTAQTTGVFQLESSGMKRYLKDLKPTHIEDIIAMVALRPGPMELVPDYRATGRKQAEYLHPALEPILRNTYGVMVYQEQLAAVRALVGFLAEADILRKAVGKKINSLLDEQEGKFIEGAKRVGTPDAIAKKFWALVEPFNRYAFNRSHAACYAMLAYQTAYLKANWPSEFMAAFLNSETGDVERGFCR